MINIALSYRKSQFEQSNLAFKRHFSVGKFNVIERWILWIVNLITRING